MQQLRSCWKTFLSDRIQLYEICETVRVFPGLISPSHFYKLDERFSDAVCAEIDKGLAQYVLWYEGRRDERRKAGKNRWESKYKDLKDLLGVTEEERRGGWTDGDALTSTSKSYLEAFTQAVAEGRPVPDVAEWLAAQSGEDEQEEGDSSFPGW
jgi:hypothetical protein